METKFAPRVQGIEISGIRRIFEAAGKDSINLGLGQPDLIPLSISRMLQLERFLKEKPVIQIVPGFPN